MAKKTKTIGGIQVNNMFSNLKMFSEIDLIFPKEREDELYYLVNELDPTSCNSAVEFTTRVLENFDILCEIGFFEYDDASKKSISNYIKNQPIKNTLVPIIGNETSNVKQYVKYVDGTFAKNDLKNSKPGKTKTPLYSKDECIQIFVLKFSENSLRDNETKRNIIEYINMLYDNDPTLNPHLLTTEDYVSYILNKPIKIKITDFIENLDRVETTINNSDDEDLKKTFGRKTSPKNTIQFMQNILNYFDALCDVGVLNYSESTREKVFASLQSKKIVAQYMTILNTPRNQNLIKAYQKMK